MFQILQILQILAAFQLVFTCPFTSYDDALLHSTNPQQSTQIIFSTEGIGDSIGFGFWSQCIPLWSVKQQKQVDDLYNIQLLEEGQFLFLLKQEISQINVLLSYVEFDQVTPSVNHKILLYDAQQQNIVQKSYPPLDYEGIWIFTYFTLQLGKKVIIVEMSNQMSEEYSFKIDPGLYTLIIGGRGFISFDQESINLNFYRGRLSTLIYEESFDYNEEHFPQVESLCLIPPKLIGLQTENLLPGLQYFDGQTYEIRSIDQYGNRYQIHGWAKLDASKIISSIVCEIIRITTFQDFTIQQYIGNQIFHLQYQVIPGFQTFLTSNVDQYDIPLQKKINLEDYSKFNYDIEIPDPSVTMFDVVQEWHFFQYEYGRTSGCRSMLKIYFSKPNIEITQCFGFDNLQGSFTNTKLYIILGGQTSISAKNLYGYLSEIKFIYNYENDFGFAPTCHYSCKDCSGPLQNNCKSCPENSNRQLLEEQNVCKCEYSYLDIVGEPKCLSFLEAYSGILEQEIQETNNVICQFGFFQIATASNLCVACPQYQSKFLKCVDCLFHPLTWYLEPKCTQDLVTFIYDGNSAFSLVTNDPLNWDIYIIDQNYELQMYFGVEKFCESEEFQSGCFQTNLQHLGQVVSVICKQNHFFSQNTCILLDPYCLSVNSDKICTQCQENYYLYQNRCYNCHLQCLNCQYNVQIQEVQCLACLERHALVGGGCQPCGRNCKICINYNDDLLKTNYLRCYRCEDDYNYFLSLDAVNCIQNTEQNCKLAFQAVKDDYTINSLDFYFDPQQSENVVTLCAVCDRNFLYVIPTQTCIPGFDVICDVSVTNLVNPTAIEETECLAVQGQYGLYQFSGSCNAFLNNCDTCIYGRQSNFLECLICSAGYYSKKITGVCYKCPPELNCMQCYQENKYIKDNWKIKAQAFYKLVVNKDQKHAFIVHGQSQNQDDYEIVCNSCKSGYEIYQGKCILSCPDQCLECQLIEGQNICTKCYMDEFGRQLSLSNNSCISCQGYCALCRVREQEEIFQINPFFQSKQFLSSTFQCIKAYESMPNLFYDQQLGQFIHCDLGEGCKKTFTIIQNLYCSHFEYKDQLSKVTSDDMRKKFRQENVLIDDLFSTSHSNFAEFEQDNFYFNANQKYIKLIEILIISQEKQNCLISGEAVLTQLFSQNIFSAINVQIKFIGKKSTTIQLDRSISFVNFTSITFENIHFQSVINEREKQIHFKSATTQIVSFVNCSYEQLNQKIDSMQFIFDNLQKVMFSNFKITHINSSNGAFFLFNGGDQLEYLQVQGLILKNVNYYSSNFLQIQGKKNLTISVRNLTVYDSFFYNSSLITFATEKQTQLTIQQLVLINTQIKSISGFLNIAQISTVRLENLIIQNCAITQTILITISNHVILQTLNMKSCTITKDSQILVNKDSTQLDIIINLSEIIFDTNQYDSTIKFIKLLGYKSQKQEIILTQVSLLGNEVIGNISENQQLNYETSLIFISSSLIIINKLIIERGVGLPEISLVNSNYLQIEELLITQGERFKFRALTQHLDCIIQYLLKPYYPPSIFVRSSNNVFMNSIKIYSVYTYNQPLISFTFPEVQKSGQNGKIQLQNGYFNQSILIIQQQLQGIALIFIKSNSLVEVEIKNITFFGNLLHEYTKSELISSAALLNIECLQCRIELENLQIMQNLVINSTDSIIYVNSKSILIDGCVFQENSQFMYDIIKPFVLLGKNQIYLEQLAAVFRILSSSGNGFYLSEDIRIQDSKILKSTGYDGGAFKIQLYGQSKLECENIIFDQVQIKGVKMGGAFNIDTKFSSSCIIKVTNIQIKNTFSISLGGLLYIVNGQGSLDIQLQNLQISDVYAKAGSIIYCSFLSTSNSFQHLSIKGVQYSNDLQKLATFFGQFTTKRKVEVQEILNSRNLIFVEYGTEVILENFLIEKLHHESLFHGQSLQKITLKNIRIANAQVPYLINIVPKANEYFSFSIQGFEIYNSIQNELVYEFMQCFQINKEIPSFQFQCQNIFTVQNLPPSIDRIIEENTSILLECFQQVDQYYSKLSESEAGMINISELNQVQEINIKKILFKNFNCKLCNSGLISLKFQKTVETVHQTRIQSVEVQDNQCGNSGCIVIGKGDTNMNSPRILNEVFQSIQTLGYDLFISDFICTNNKASYGTCLNIISFSTILSKCVFKNNLAIKQGGAVYLSETQGRFIILHSIITQNSAEIGGGIASLDSVFNNYQLFNTDITKNQASFYGDNQASLPIFLKLSINKTGESYENYQIEKNEHLLIQGVGNSSTVIHLPSGQPISEYYYFDWKSQTYIYPELNFRITAVDQFDVIDKSLVNHYCQITSRVYNISEVGKQANFTNNFTNLQQIYFNNSTKDFNLDNLIILFDSDQPLVLQLEFWCSPIVVPIFKQEPPYNILGTHSNYYFRVNIRTLPCTFGQIKNISDSSCYTCNSKLNYFSLNVGASKCQIIDDVTTISVQSAKLQLRQYYWRPYFDTSHITYCLNLPENCNGGWTPGDDSCVEGHIGALCEQCDLYNIKGQGFYSISEKYTCGLCSSTNLNLGMMIGTIIWTLFSLILSVKSTLQTAEKHIKQTQSKILGFTVFYKIAQSGVIIKILTNYLQIIASLSTFQLHLPINISNIINVFGNPIQSISYSQDCIISKFWNIQIHYSRIIWQLLQPFFFYMMFLIIYLILVKTNTLIFNYSVLSTSILYLFIYFQPNWIYELISLISYRYISGFQWIQNNVSYRYDTYIHQQWIIKFCLPIIILLIVIIPILLLFGLILNRHKLNNKQTKIIWGYLYNEYRLTSYFWEILKIVEKDLIIIVLVYYEEDVVIKGILVILIVQIYQVLNSIYQPYYLYKFNSIDMQTSNVCQISFTLGVGIYISDQHQIKQIQNIFYVLLAVFNIFQFFSLLIQILSAYMTEAEYILDKVKDKLSQIIPGKYKSKFVIRLLNNKGERRKKIEENFLRIKIYLLHQAKLIMELKQPQNFRQKVKSNNNVQLQKQILKNRNNESESIIIYNHLSPGISHGTSRAPKSPFAKSPNTKSPLFKSNISFSNAVSPCAKSPNVIQQIHMRRNHKQSCYSRDLIQISEEDDVQIDKIDEEV